VASPSESSGDREDQAPWSPLRSTAFPRDILCYFILTFLSRECFYLSAFHHRVTAGIFFLYTSCKCAKEKGRMKKYIEITLRTFLLKH